MSVLDSIKSIDDLKSVPSEQIEQLCDDIRLKLINDVSKTGGHLASNLGVVELTIALDRAYDPFKDRIVFDVGHQCYTHKILTGRSDEFEHLRQLNGISGFPKPNESKADAFIAGHASNSISVALGMARARTLLNNDYKVVAVIGDGALTGGLAYEGLSNAGCSKEPLVVILNDNNMSISKNVGGIAKSLSKLRTSKAYTTFKNAYNGLFHNPDQLKLKARIHDLKERMKQGLLSDNMFVDMGFDYIGPIDGHNEKELENTLRYARGVNHPVLVHIITKKGKGYGFAEGDPNKFHGIGKFYPATGELVNPSKESYAVHFGKTLTELADHDPRIMAITAAMKDGTGLNEFEKKHKNRFFDVGIAEGHAVSMASGMASQGAVPVFCVYSSFLQRSYDMLIHDASLQNLHIVIGDDHAGLVGEDGETHNGCFDISFLRSVPNMTILCPSNFAEMDEMLKTAIFTIDGPVTIRYPKGGERGFNQVCTDATTILCEGKDVTIVSYGDLINEALSAKDLLLQQGVEAEIIKLNRLNPIDSQLINDSIDKTKHLVVVEDVCENGSVGEAIAAQASKALAFDCTLLNVGNGIVRHGTVAQLYQLYQLDGEGICTKTLELLKK